MHIWETANSTYWRLERVNFYFLLYIFYTLIFRIFCLKDLLILFLKVFGINKFVSIFWKILFCGIPNIKLYLVVLEFFAFFCILTFWKCVIHTCSVEPLILHSLTRTDKKTGTIFTYHFYSQSTCDLPGYVSSFLGIIRWFGNTKYH